MTPNTMPGCGTIDGHDEDDDLRLLRDAIDKRTSNGDEPGDDFWSALYRRHRLLVRCAEQIGQPGPPSINDPLDPHTIRVCASYLLAN